MSGANSVTSNQETLHKDLEEVVRKYARTTFLRPIADHTREAFAEAETFVEKFYGKNGAPGTASGVTNAIRDGAPGANAETAPRAVILDSGCGTGESTIHIARRFPGIPVIGIDKSCARLNKAGNPSQTAGEDAPANAFWIRAELLDFWRLALEHVKSGKWTIPYHAVYYPNPWPKQSEATRRFHMHPIFPTLLALGKTIELRTNWEIYAREFAEAARIVFEERAKSADAIAKGDHRLLRLRSALAPAGMTDAAGMTIKCESFDPIAPETAFERKYKEARQKLWRVTVLSLL
jgi:tRNA G46 methylase TrmB